MRQGPRLIGVRRNFFKEVATIVVGVMIALGAEQVVLSVRNAQRSQEAREAVRDELNLDLANVYRRRAIQPCIDRRIAEIGEILDRAEHRQPFETPRTIGLVSGQSIAVQRWQAATAGGRTSLLSSAEQRDFARIYNQLLRLISRQQDEEHAWSQLQILEGLDYLSPQVLAQARTALSEARTQNYGVRDNMEMAATYAARIGIKGDAALVPMNRGKISALCLSITTPRSEALRLVDSPIGLP